MEKNNTSNNKALYYVALMKVFSDISMRTNFPHLTDSIIIIVIMIRSTAAAEKMRENENVLTK
jgi:hypothetical protein